MCAFLCEMGSGKKRHSMDSDQYISSDPLEFPSQPTQLLQHALAPQSQEQTRSDRRLVSPNDGGNVANDFSLDSSIMPVRPAPPNYHLQVSPLLRSSRSGERVLAEQEIGRKIEELATPSPSPSGNVPIQGSSSSSEPFRQHGDSPLSASAPKVIATRTVFFQPPTSAASRARSLSRPSRSMPTGNKYYRRSPSLPSQDSFGGPISQDLAEQYLASAKQFAVPLSDLGETPTQKVIHSPPDPEATLPDATGHKGFANVAVHKSRAQRATSNGHADILVVGTPSVSSSASQNKDDDVSFQGRGCEFGVQESRFEFSGPSSSFDKMLCQGLAGPPDSTQEQATQPDGTQPTQPDSLTDAEPSATHTFLTTPPQNSQRLSPLFDWIAPTPTADVASSNPRSLLRLVHPDNKDRIDKIRNLVGNVDLPSHAARIQPFRMEETEHCCPDEPCLMGSCQDNAVRSRSTRRRVEKPSDLEDALDVVPDSEPLRAGLSTQTPDRYRIVTRTPLKKVFRPISPISEHESGDPVPDSLEVEESEADVPLAIELASRNTGRSPAQDIVVQDTSSLKASLSAQDQSRKPFSSWKGPRIKSSAEPTEVPTSLPEQDLQSQIFRSSKKQGNGAQPSSARHGFASHLATKLVAGKKRSRSSDTEDSDDLPCQPTGDEEGRCLAVHKEEEESGSPYNYDVDTQPPPPPRPDSSHKKRRRTEGANRRGASHTLTSTRSKRLETPAVATRSAQRLRSRAGVSSTRAPAGLATQVFALWKHDGHFYSGVVYSREVNNKYLIKFDDGTKDEVELKNIRRRQLLVGDRVILRQEGPGVQGIVSNISCADPDGPFTLEIDDGEASSTVQAEFVDIRIASRTIQSRWSKRMIVAENIITVVQPKSPIDSTPSKQSIASTVSSKAQRELAKTGFVVTLNPKNEDPDQTKDEVMRAVKQRGGMVINDWSKVFVMEGKHTQSNKRWCATREDFRWKPETKLNRVFLLSDDAHQKPKFLLALALGIPCLSFEWLTREGELPSDWQPFLLPAGYSDTLGARVSQFIDLDWGNCVEHVVDIMDNRVPAKLFLKKAVLCIGADLVPPPPGKDTDVEPSQYVPWIILCMGAANVEAVTDTRQVSPEVMQTFDYVIVKERSVLGSVRFRKNVVRDVNWVKECLVSSRLFDSVLD